MITLTKLKWGNCFSYGDHNYIDFTAEAVTQIVGANGNGKSSIPLILEEVLYNKNSKGMKKTSIPNRYIGTTYWITLELTIDGIDYEIDVVRGSTINIKLRKGAEDISSHTATNTLKKIEEIIGTDFKTFSQLIYQSPNSSLQFLTATDTNRKKFLIDLLQLDEYVRLFDLFKEEVKNHSTNVTHIQGQIKTVENWLNTNKLDNIEIQPLLELNIDFNDDETKYAELSVELNNIEKTNKTISSNNHYKQLLSSIDIAAIQAVEVEELKTYDDEQKDLGGLNSELNRKKTYITKLKFLGDVCPTCEQDIKPEFKNNLISAEEEEVEVIVSKIQEMNTVIASIKKNNRKHKNKYDSIKEWEDLHRSVNPKLPKDLIDKEELRATIDNLAIRISNAKTKLRQVTAHNQEISRQNSRVQVMLEQGEKFSEQLKTLTSQIQEESETLSNLELLKKSFSTNGLIAYKIENLVKDLESLTNDYLAELSDGRFTIEYSVANDKLNVNITDNGFVIDIADLSSGELARVNTATLLALRKLMSSISSSRVNVLFLDEVISVLDDEGRDKLVEILIEEELNTYLVSHSWEHPLLKKLEVVKENNISRILE